MQIIVPWPPLAHLSHCREHLIVFTHPLPLLMGGSQQSCSTVVRCLLILLLPPRHLMTNRSTLLHDYSPPTGDLLSSPPLCSTAAVRSACTANQQKYYIPRALTRSTKTRNESTSLYGEFIATQEIGDICVNVFTFGANTASAEDGIYLLNTRMTIGPIVDDEGNPAHSLLTMYCDLVFLLIRTPAQLRIMFSQIVLEGYATMSLWIEFWEMLSIDHIQRLGHETNGHEFSLQIIDDLFSHSARHLRSLQ
ncbi:uncharacterized protein HD556DRAFT_436222 [Suillus plorans]|uniref:Uncharacterized protein n=1 Tax=Suillus plorans TaxID=116603 RepID=A0A9P7AT05_9AGAM|nr:uncharacterized protein HD556DRAFT_436222 [Suillus plorans]KAG1794458.1 hypothetical protein HD556DRAFT_436222 [Suillus plorans]